MSYLVAALLIQTALMVLFIYLLLRAEYYNAQANKVILAYNRLLREYDFVPQLKADGQKLYRDAVRRLR
jgi:hypothetical protein